MPRLYILVAIITKMYATGVHTKLLQNVKLLPIIIVEQVPFSSKIVKV